MAAALAYTAAGCVAVCCGEGVGRLVRRCGEDVGRLVRRCREGAGRLVRRNGEGVGGVGQKCAGVRCLPRRGGAGADAGFLFGVWGILLLSWMPAYLALFPGTFGYDVPEQMQQFFGGMPLTSHHPVLHTWLVGLCLQAGEGLFKSWQAGFAVFSFLQGMVVTNSLACSLLFLKRRRVPVLVLFLGLFGCALHPILQILSFNATKDTLFGAFFLYFMMAFIAVLEKSACPGGGAGKGRKGEGRRRKRECENEKGACGRRGACVWLVFFGVLMCLFRNQGVYIVLALAVFCLLFRAGRGLAVVCLGVIFLVSECFFLFCSHGLKIPEGDKREMLCVPMQQVANVWQNQENADISPEQRAAVEEVIEQGALLDYLPACADPVKVGFHTEVLMEDPVRYLRVYLEVGLRNPGLYVDAFRAMVVPYLDGSLYRVPETALEFTFPDANEWGIERNSLFPAYEAYLEKVVSSPVGVFFLQPGMAVWLLVILAGIAFCRRNGRLFLGILPGALFFGTLLLSSGALLRYIYPLMLAVPLYLGLLFEGVNGAER